MKITVRLLFAALCAAFALSNGVSGADANSYSGMFWNQTKDAIFEIRLTDSSEGPSIEGITRWSMKPVVDARNPDPALRTRSLKDVTFLWGFTYDARKNRWKDGKVYDPNNGKTYDAKMELENGGDTLKMRGYIGVSLLGRTARFERVQAKDLPVTFDTD